VIIFELIKEQIKENNSLNILKKSVLFSFNFILNIFENLYIYKIFHHRNTHNFCNFLHKYKISKFIF